MIRQSVSCDICGTEKKQTNHWFVARECEGELRLGGWSSRNRSRNGSKHLCGQTCLHKLVDEFMARSISARGQAAAAEAAEPEMQPSHTDTSLTSAGAHNGLESSARLLAPANPLPNPLPLKRPPASVAALAHAAAPTVAEVSTTPPADEPPVYSSRAWRAEAWERERERESRSPERRPEAAGRRRS